MGFKFWVSSSFFLVFSSWFLVSVSGFQVEGKMQRVRDLGSSRHGPGLGVQDCWVVCFVSRVWGLFRVKEVEC